MKNITIIIIGITIIILSATQHYTVAAVGMVTGALLILMGLVVHNNPIKDSTPKSTIITAPKTTPKPSTITKEFKEIPTYGVEYAKMINNMIK